MKRIAKSIIIFGVVCCASGLFEISWAQVRSLPKSTHSVPHHAATNTVSPATHRMTGEHVTNNIVGNGLYPTASYSTGPQLSGPPPVGIPAEMQTVQLRLPQGTLYSFALGTQFVEPTAPEQIVALRVGPTYRFRISNIPYNEEFELFPSIRLFCRLHPPQGRETRFPIVVDLTQEDLELALNGKLVTRIVYLEDPARAIPVNSKDGPISQDIPPGANPLVIAETLGRPIAIVQVGARIPDENGFYGSPDWQSPGQANQEVYTAPAVVPQMAPAAPGILTSPATTPPVPQVVPTSRAVPGGSSIIYRGAAPEPNRSVQGATVKNAVVKNQKAHRKTGRNQQPQHQQTLRQVRQVQFEDFNFELSQGGSEQAGTQKNATFPPQFDLSLDFGDDFVGAVPVAPVSSAEQQWEALDSVPSNVPEEEVQMEQLPMVQYEIVPGNMFEDETAEELMLEMPKRPAVAKIAAISRIGQLTMQSEDLSDELQIEPELAEKQLSYPPHPDDVRSVPRLEYLFDGGDADPQAVVRANQLLKGLAPEDTIVVYESKEGQQFVHPSNRVPVYSPRFGSVRLVEGISVNEQRQLATANNQTTRLNIGRTSIPVGITEQELTARYARSREEVEGIRSRQQGSIMAGKHAADEYKQTAQAVAYSSVLIREQITSQMTPHLLRGRENALCWSGAQGVLVRVGEIALKEMIGTNKAQSVFQVDDGQPIKEIRFIKVADREAALPGETVEFTLRFENVCREELQNLTFFDSLTARLEFLPGSAKSSVPASFHVEPNEAGSMVLRWDLKQPLKPSEYGVIVFQCRVR